MLTTTLLSSFCRRNSVEQLKFEYSDHFLVQEQPHRPDPNVKWESMATTTLDIREMRASIRPIVAASPVFPVPRKGNDSFPQRISVGRSVSNSIVLRDETISKLHAFFVSIDDDKLAIYDAGSSNGTYVGAKAAPNFIEGGAPLEVNSGDRLRFGARTFVYYDAADLHAALVVIPT